MFYLSCLVLTSNQLYQYDITLFFLLKNFAPFPVWEHRKSSIEKFEKIIYKNVSQNKFQQLVEAGELYLRRTNFNENLYGAIEHQQMEDLIWALHNKRVILVESITINPANIDLQRKEFPLKCTPWSCFFTAEELGKEHELGEWHELHEQRERRLL